MYKDKIESLKRQKEQLAGKDFKIMSFERRSQNLDSWIQYFEHKQKQWEKAVKR